MRVNPSHESELMPVQNLPRGSSGGMIELSSSLGNSRDRMVK